MTGRIVSLGGVLLLFVASRLLYVALIDANYLLNHQADQLYDELYLGTIAQELVTGLSMPFTEYRETNYALGKLVIGALAAGFFLLFGPTLFALKLAPLFLFLLTLVFWYLTIQRHASEREAGYFALLFCFSPPLFTTYSVVAHGDHPESIVFSALTVWLLFNMLSLQKPSSAYPVLLGLTAGFGLWFAYIYGLTLLAMLGFWFWHKKGRFWRPLVLWFALGFVVGFSPWIMINLQTHFAGLVIHGGNVWEHFGFTHLWDALAHPLKLAPIEFFRTIASDDTWDSYRRTVNLLYSLLYLGPLLTAGVLRLKTARSAPAGTTPTRPTLVGFALLYLPVFALAVQCSDFRSSLYHLPAYPFLFFLIAHSLARCQDLVPRAQRQVQTVFLASVVVLGLGAHAPLLSLDRPGFALSAKGYAYALLPVGYWETHEAVRSGDREFLLEAVRGPFLSSILPKLLSDDQRDLSRAIVRILAEAAPLNGQAEDFARLERMVPPGFDRYFYYSLGAWAIYRHRNELLKAVKAAEFVRHRSAVAHHLALVGIYRQWPRDAALDRTPESVVTSPAPVAPELSAHYWRALGHYAGRYWYNTDRSLSLLTAHLQSFLPRLDPTVQRAFLQGVGQALFPLPYPTHWPSPAELERFPPAYQESLFEGWGMALGDHELSTTLPWKGRESPYWTAWTKSLSAKSLVSVQRGKAQIEALLEGAPSSALKPSLSQ